MPNFEIFPPQSLKFTTKAYQQNSTTPYLVFWHIFEFLEIVKKLFRFLKSTSQYDECITSSAVILTIHTWAVW
jgi:hypothetical protein